MSLRSLEALEVELHELTERLQKVSSHNVPGMVEPQAAQFSCETWLEVGKPWENLMNFGNLEVEVRVRDFLGH